MTGRVLETAESIVNTEELFSLAPGSSRWILTTKVPLIDKTGTVTGLVGISRDITERKQAEQRLLSLARFPDENPYPILRVTPDGLIIYSNKASELLTASWADGAERRVPEEFMREVTPAWKTGQKREIEVRESSRIYAIAIVPFTDAGYINLYGRDVTEEKTLSEMLTQAQKMEAIGQLTRRDRARFQQRSSGHHRLLRGAHNKDYLTRTRSMLEEITKAANRAATLTAQLLAFSRKQVLRPQVVDTKELIRSVRKMLERVIGEDIELRTFVDPKTGNFLADPGQMEQVLMNLAVNARDAMPSGGKLTIETSNCALDDAYVRDHPGAKVGTVCPHRRERHGSWDGPGTLSHIYEPFFTTKEIGKGTGLGLSTVYGIVKQSDGYITCYSETGRGTTFTIYLPPTLEETDKLAAVSDTTAPKGTETILLVDDDPSVRKVAAIILQAAGYVVMKASGGEEALSVASARGTSIALLITDVVMPRMGGIELANRLQKSCPRLKVLYVSGYTADVISRHGILEAGVNYVQKPFKSLDFLTKVREILDGPPVL